MIVYLMQLDNLIEQSSLTLLLLAVQPIWTLELTQKVIQHKKKPLLLCCGLCDEYLIHKQLELGYLSGGSDYILEHIICSLKYNILNLVLVSIIWILLHTN